MHAKYKRLTFLFSLRDNDSDYIIATITLKNIGTLQRFFETIIKVLFYVTN